MSHIMSDIQNTQDFNTVGSRQQQTKAGLVQSSEQITPSKLSGNGRDGAAPQGFQDRLERRFHGDEGEARELDQYRVQPLPKSQDQQIRSNLGHQNEVNVQKGFQDALSPPDSQSNIMNFYGDNRVDGDYRQRRIIQRTVSEQNNQIAKESGGVGSAAAVERIMRENDQQDHRKSMQIDQNVQVSIDVATQTRMEQRQSGFMNKDLEQLETDFDFKQNYTVKNNHTKKKIRMKKKVKKSQAAHLRHDSGALIETHTMHQQFDSTSLNQTNLNDKSQVALVPHLDRSVQEFDMSIKNASHDQTEINHMFHRINRNNQSDEQSNGIFKSDNGAGNDNRYNSNKIKRHFNETQPDFNIYNQSESVQIIQNQNDKNEGRPQRLKDPSYSNNLNILNQNLESDPNFQETQMDLMQNQTQQINNDSDEELEMTNFHNKKKEKDHKQQKHVHHHSVGGGIQKHDGSEQTQHTFTHRMLHKLKDCLIKKQQPEISLKDKNKTFMNNLKSLASNADKEKVEYYWSLIRKALNGPDRDEILLKIKLTEIEYHEEEEMVDESLLLHHLHHHEEHMQEQSTVEYTQWRTWPTFIKIGSPLHTIWEFLYVFLFMLYILFMVPQELCTFHMSHLEDIINGNDEFVMQTLLAFFTIDILYNLIVEHPLQDNIVTKFFHQNVVEYLLTRTFVKDLAVVLPFTMLVYLDDNYRKQMIIDRINGIYHIDRLNDPNDYESGFNTSSEQVYNNQEGVKDDFTMLGKFHMADFYDLILLMTLVKATDQTRIIRAKERLDEILEELMVNMQFTSTMRKRILIFVDIIEILLALMISIHFVNCIWMYISDNVHQDLMQIYLKHTQSEEGLELAAIHLEEEVQKTYFKNLYLTILYLSVIGYGDPVSMPDLTTFQRDYSKLLLCMLFGFFVFQKINAQLNRFISSIEEEQTLELMKENVLEQLESYFLFHNQMKGPKMLLVKDMEEWKKVVDMSFQFNYKAIQNSYFYKELYPSLQVTLMDHLIKRETRHFPLFFQHQRRDGSRGQSLTPKMVADLMSLVECEILPAGRMIMSPQVEFKQLYLIRKGTVKMFDNNYNMLCQLKQGSYFGEYQIMFGLYSDYYYQSCEEPTFLFKIEALDFMKAICLGQLSYKHFFELSIQKLRFHSNLKKRLKMQIPQKFKEKDHGIDNKQIKLCSIFEMQARNIGNESIQDFYDGLLQNYNEYLVQKTIKQFQEQRKIIKLNQKLPDQDIEHDFADKNIHTDIQSREQVDHGLQTPVQEDQELEPPQKPVVLVFDSDDEDIEERERQENELIDDIFDEVGQYVDDQFEWDVLYECDEISQNLIIGLSNNNVQSKSMNMEHQLEQQMIHEILQMILQSQELNFDLKILNVQIEEYLKSLIGSIDNIKKVFTDNQQYLASEYTKQKQITAYSRAGQI